jgi:hypothetical protein
MLMLPQVSGWLLSTKPAAKGGKCSRHEINTTHDLQSELVCVYKRAHVCSTQRLVLLLVLVVPVRHSSPRASCIATALCTCCSMCICCAKLTRHTDVHDSAMELHWCSSHSLLIMRNTYHAQHP